MAAKRPRLTQRRKAIGFSQESLARTLHVERSTVVRWENGETAPQPWLRPRLTRALRLSLGELDELLANTGDDSAGTYHPDGLGPRAAPLIDTPGLAGTETEFRWRGVPDTAWPLASSATRWAASPVCQLPPAVADFTGRQWHLTELTEMLSRDRDVRVAMPVAVIAGLPGAGKTTLALQVSHTVRLAFPDGQLWVTLEGATGRPRDPGEVLGELIRTLGVPGSAIPEAVSERASLYRSLLAGRRILVLADDAASAAQVKPLLPGTGPSAVLITSRSELAGPPGSRLIPLDPLTRADASVDRALALARDLGEPGLEHEVLHSVASTYSAVGRHEEALQLSQNGLTMAQRLGMKAAIAEWLGVSGDAFRGLGRYREAADSLLSALPIFNDHFMHRHHGLCLLKLGYTYQAMGDGQAAARYLQESLDIFGRLELPHYQARARDALLACQELDPLTQHGARAWR